MAIIYTEKKECPKCKEYRTFSSNTTSFKENCNECNVKEAEAKTTEVEDNHIAELEKLPTTKRLELIERWIFNHKKG